MNLSLVKAQYSSIGSDDGLASDRWKASIWTKVCLSCWRIYAPINIYVLNNGINDGECCIRVVWILWHVFQTGLMHTVLLTYHQFLINPYVSGLFCTCGANVIQCVLNISWYLSPNNSQKMSRSLPIRTRFGVSLWIHSMFSISSFRIVFNIGLYSTAIYRVVYSHIIAPRSRDHPWMWNMVSSGQLFTGRWGFLPQGLVGYRSREIGCYLIVSLWSLTGIPAALPRCLSNFKVIEEI